MVPVAYKLFVKNTIDLAMKKAETFWFTYNQIHDHWVKRLLGTWEGVWYYRQIIWTYTFGQYQDGDFTSCYRPFICLASRELNFDAIREPSARMLLGDSRAAGPRVPGDVWDFPRVVGNSPERRAWHKTQLPEALIRRILLLSCFKTVAGSSKVIGPVCDLFLGSGTTGIVANQLGVPWDGCEISESYFGHLKALFGQ